MSPLRYEAEALRPQEPLELCYVHPVAPWSAKREVRQHVRKVPQPCRTRKLPKVLKPTKISASLKMRCRGEGGRMSMCSTNRLSALRDQRREARIGMSWVQINHGCAPRHHQRVGEARPFDADG